MLWLAVYFPGLPLRVFHDPGRQPFALSERIDGRERITRCNRRAREQGLYPGMPLASALALCGGLRVRPRDRRAEQALLRDRAQQAYRFSSRIAFDPLCLLIEIGASLRLMGGLEPLLQTVLAALCEPGERARHAVAPTPGAASLLARCRPGTRVLRREAIREALADIPLARLSRDPRARRLMQDIGLRTLGECLALPREGLARRTGPELLRHIDQVLGLAPDPRPAWRPPTRFEQTLPLCDEIEHAPALLFPAQRLVERLARWLRARDGATDRLHWRLHHRARPPTSFDTGLLAPDREPERLLRGLRERCERLCLPAPVTALGLRVSDIQPADTPSGGLFPAPSRPDLHWLERLYNRLGETCIRGLRSRPDHRPEQAWQWCPPGRSEAQPPRPGAQPLWLLPRPRPLRERGLQLLQGPQRIEAGWWDGQDVARDYFVARTRDGTRLWIYLDRRSGHWHVHGYLD